MEPNVNVQATTNQYLAPMWTDQVLRDNSWFGFILDSSRLAKKWEGSQLLFPIKYQKGVSSVAFSGFDLLPITWQPVTVNSTFYPSFVASNVALAGTDLSVNKTQMQTLDLMQVSMQSRAQDAADDIGNYLQGSGQADGGKAPMGLAGIVDDGTTLSTYGGLARATYTGLNATVTASSGTISLLKVRTLWNNVSDGPVRPDVILTTYDVWAYFEQLLQPTQRATMTQVDLKGAISNASGYADLYWDGMKIFRDKKVTSGNFYMLNTNFTKFHPLKFWQGTSVSPSGKDIEGNVYEDRMYTPSAFTWTGWINAYNQLAVNGYMVFAGQLISTSPFRNGVLTGVTGV